MPRRILYVTGSRADFGLALHMLRVIDGDARLDLQVLVTGEHLVERHGFTAREVHANKLRVAASVDMLLAGDTPRAMASGVGLAILGITSAIDSIKPDVVLVLGDRGEMLAAAIAALHLGVFVAHVHGGEQSGTVDGSVRHAISSLAHFHFAASASAAAWLRRRGEPADRVFETGAPGLDAVLAMPLLDRGAIALQYGLDPARPWVVLLHHPDTITGSGTREIEAILEGLRSYPGQIVVFEPNSDAGREPILSALRGHWSAGARLLKTVPRDHYLSLVRWSQLMIGNSSSGIIETPSLGVPFVCVGHRQDGRERGRNVIDVPSPVAGDVEEAVRRACEDEAFLSAARECWNPHGDGNAGRRIGDLLATVPLDREKLQKRLCV